MTAQKVWHDELQAWVYEDPDIPDVEFPDELNTIDITNLNLSKATLPLNILEGRPLHAKVDKSK